MIVLLAALELTILVHEASHALVARALGCTVGVFVDLPWRLGVRVTFPGDTIPRGHDAAIALAGPLGSIVVGMAAGLAGAETFGALSILAGLVSLVPFVPGNDGTRVWRAVLR